jgi:hypothetical protein
MCETITSKQGVLNLVVATPIFLTAISTAALFFRNAAWYLKSQTDIFRGCDGVAPSAMANKSIAVYFMKN